MRYVFAASSGTTWIDGHPVTLHIDDPWDADDPFVKARPDLFKPEPTKLGRTVPGARTVEAATAAPGERRTAKRG